MKKQIYLKVFYLISLVLFIAILIYLFATKNYFSQKQIFSQSSSSSISKDDYLKTLQLYLSDKKDYPTSKKQIIKRYCASLLSGVLKDGFEYQVFYYKPGNSVFLYTICGYVDDELKNKFDDEMKNSVKDFDMKNLDHYDQECDNKTNMNGCNIAVLLSDLFTKLMDEYSNLKLASIYGYAEGSSNEELIKAFSNKYFSGDCGDGKYYLYKEKIEEKKYAFCSHPETYKVLESYIKSVKTAIQNLEILNHTEVMKLDGNKIFKKAFVTKNGTWVDFRNVLFNELLYYKLFLGYYGQLIHDDATFSKFAVGSNVSLNFEQNVDEIIVINHELEISQKAVTKMDQIIRNLYANFPVHIGLKAYQEDMINFRNSYIKIYTPIDQLLRENGGSLWNVQDIDAE